MRRRYSARTLITLTCTATTAIVVTLLISVAEQSLSDIYAAAIPDTAAALWTVGAFLTVLTALAVWAVTGYLLGPIGALRRDVALSARSRAVAEGHAGELEELQSLRLTIAAAIRELEGRAAAAETERHRVLGLFESTSEGIVQVSGKGRFVHVNAAARRLLRLPHDAEGQAVTALIRNVELREIFERAATNESSVPAEVLVDGRQLLVAPQIVRGYGENMGVVVSVVDLTELRRLEGVRRDFVANVSHELKTPLTAIRGYAETLLSDELPRADQLQFLGVIEKNARRLQNVVDDLLDLSRLQSGGWRPELQEVDVAGLATDVWLTCQPLNDNSGIAFSVSGNARVVADPGGLRQVLSNIVGNALRYTPAGGGIHVEITPPDAVADGKRMVTIAVRDSGSGIPRDALPRIFERFYRVDPARSRAEGGTGLGLSIVKHLVDRMGGDVWAESEPGKGTTISIQLLAAE